jgi:translation elongation factor EF-Tu-like GTPase
MSQEILKIEDVFQVPERGAVVTGVRGEAWELAQVGDTVELKSPDGRSMRNGIRSLEIFRKGVLSGPPFPGGILLADIVASDELPRGTLVFTISS